MSDEEISDGKIEDKDDNDVDESNNNNEDEARKCIVEETVIIKEEDVVIKEEAVYDVKITPTYGEVEDAHELDDNDDKKDVETNWYSATVTVSDDSDSDSDDEVLVDVDDEEGMDNWATELAARFTQYQTRNGDEVWDTFDPNNPNGEAPGNGVETGEEGVTPIIEESGNDFEIEEGGATPIIEESGMNSGIEADVDSAILDEKAGEVEGSG